MIRRHPPHKMLSLLVILLAMLSYFSIDLYTHEQPRSKAGVSDPNIMVTPENKQKPQMEKTSSAPNKEVQGGRPESNSISPGSKIIMEKRYLKCGHTVSSQSDMPANMVNLTEDQLKLAYTGWVIQKFSPQEVEIYQNIDTKCPYHYVLRVKDGYVAVYYQTPINGVSLKEVTPILVGNLRLEDQERLKSGIKIDSQQALAQALEDLGS